MLKNNKKEKKKSPLTAKPLRYPAQSTDEHINKLFDEKLEPYILISFSLIGLTIMEWVRYFQKSPPSPRLYTFLTICFVLFSVYKIRKILHTVRDLKQGRDGERAVGQYLEELRFNGAAVFHDLIGDNFNLDHVLVSTKGVFAIETKTYSKPLKGKAIIDFDGKNITVNNFDCKDKEIIQVSSEATWLRSILQETTGKDFNVKPVILFPGWYIKSSEESKSSDIWVLNPKALPKFIDNLPDILATEDVQLAKYHLSRYIRSK